MIHHTQNGNYIELTFDFNPRIIADIKKVPGWKYFGKVWKIPAHDTKALQRLVGRYNKAEVVGAAAEQIGEIPPMPELTVDIPFLLKPYHYQTQGIAYCIEKKRVLIADEPGLGKTNQAIGTVAALNCKCILVICPSSLKINWQREFSKFLGWKSIILTDAIKDSWGTYHRVAGIKVFITNYESLKKYFVAGIRKYYDEKTGEEKPLRLNHIDFKDTIKTFDAVILDESHRVKEGKTMQTKLSIGISRDKEVVLCLTGTPVVNKPKDLVSQLAILNSTHLFGGHQYFMNRYCEGGNGATNLAELNYKLNVNCFYRRLKKEVLTELPDKMRQIIISDITTRKEYQDAINNLSSYLRQYRDKTDLQVQKSMAGEVMVKIQVCKNISARGKINDVIEHIDEVHASGEKIGVFIHQKEIAAALKKHYPHALTITGDDSMDQRQVSVDRFQNDPSCNLIILSIKAAGVGLTLTAASRCAFVELPWHSADCDQCEDRFHRIGQKDSVSCAYFLGKDTIDEDIYEIIEKKRAIANTITGSEDNIQKEIIDRIMNSLLNKKAA